MSKSTSEFLKDISSCIDKGSRSWDRKLSIDLLRDRILSSYSNDDFISVFSSKYWNKYPTYTYSSIKTSRSYGNLISRFISTLKDHRPDLFELALDNSTGVIHCFCLDNSGGSARIRSAKRGKKSKDQRVRLRAAKILPIRDIRSMKNDSYSAVRSAVINRIGLDNCYLDFIDDRSSYIRGQSLSIASINDIPYKDILSDDSSGGHWTRYSVIKNIFSQLSKEEIVFYLDYPDKVGSHYIKNSLKEILNSRLNS